MVLAVQMIVGAYLNLHGNTGLTEAHIGVEGAQENM